MSGAARWVKARRPSGDEGMTLMELMIGMVIMSILMGICTSAIVSMFSSTGKTQTVANTSQQLDTAFDQLDKQVRYASSIDQPTGSVANNNLSVAFQTVSPTATVCTQLRIQVLTGTTQLQLVERTWPVVMNNTGAATAGTLSSWKQLANGVALTDQNGNPVTPFTVSTPAGASLQQLRLRLVAVDGTNQVQSKSVTDTIFSALNSGPTGSGTPVCAQAGTS